MNLYKVQQYFYPYRILDIGANIGQFFTLARQTFPESYIFSIEASEACEPLLSKTVDHYYIGLLAKYNTEYKYYSRKGDPTCTGNSIYKELTSYYSNDQLEIIKKKGIRLDDLFDNKTEFELIKIDTQGSELDIIEGGLELCKKAKGILLEVSLTQYNENSPLYDEVIQYMSNIGFKAVEEIGEGYHPETHKLIQKDILFIKK